jgi:hypothetical protein
VSQEALERRDVDSDAELEDSGSEMDGVSDIEGVASEDDGNAAEAEEVDGSEVPEGSSDEDDNDIGSGYEDEADSSADELDMSKHEDDHSGDEEAEAGSDEEGNSEEWRVDMRRGAGGRVDANGVAEHPGERNDRTADATSSGREQKRKREADPESLQSLKRRLAAAQRPQKQDVHEEGQGHGADDTLGGHAGSGTLKTTTIQVGWTKTARMQMQCLSVRIRLVHAASGAHACILESLFCSLLSSQHVQEAEHSRCATRRCPSSTGAY